MRGVDDQRPAMEDREIRRAATGGVETDPSLLGTALAAVAAAAEHVLAYSCSRDSPWGIAAVRALETDLPPPPP